MAQRTLPGALQRRRLLEHIELLCECGVGIGAIAAPLCAAIRQLLGADAGSMFWVDAAGVPQGFYHETAPAELKDLFVTRFDELFGGPDELNFTTYLYLGCAPIGRSLDDDIRAWFLRGNIYKYLCRPLGHEHLLDMRVDYAGIGRAVVILWNPAERPFTAADVALLEPVRQLLQGALAAERQDARWLRRAEAGGAFVTDVSGQTLVAIDAGAEACLAGSHLLTQHIPAAGQIRRAPAFTTSLAGMLQAGLRARLELPVPDGRLIARATPMRRFAPDEAADSLMSVQLEVEVPAEAEVVTRLMDLEITPLQRRIALFAMLGRTRRECMRHFGVSEEAMKKHIRTIFRSTGAGNWSDLRQMGEA